MSAPRFVPSDSVLAQWRDEGVTVTQMVERIRERDGIEVSRGTIYSAMSRAGLTEQKRYSAFIPWSPIRKDHSTRYPLVMLRLAARRAAGETLPGYRLRKLEEWEKRLRQDNAVVTYVFDSPDGFYYVPARPGIDNGFIREVAP